MEFDISVIFASLGGVAAGSVFLTALFTKQFKITTKWLKRVISWLIPISILVIGNLLNYGFMAEFTWYATIAYGFGAGLVSNGIFDIELVQKLLDKLNLKT